MIARQETHLDKMDIWARLSAPIPPRRIGWRQDGKPTQRDGKWYARFVAYIDANFVRERLDVVVPGEWDLTLEYLPIAPVAEGEDPQTSVKARLQILGVIREDVGTGKDWKSAATDAFKRAATRFGIGHELYEFKQNWVPVKDGSSYAKPLVDPGAYYAQTHGGAPVTGQDATPQPVGDATETFDREVRQQDDPVPTANVSSPLANDDEPSCPKCGGRMWDNRLTKRNPKAPDYKCRDRNCDGVIWPAKGAGNDIQKRSGAKPGREAVSQADEDPEPSTDLLSDVIDRSTQNDDEIPF